ncbi:uncharacterized protein LOC117789535 [Drosophila innubila]|uniref:uncharacterized protein LOC117789535 n=1 Tax=Drosophila innubila TaxID=198719 RepID=UPI00148D9A75|nr:uncharacterized protein LOC117789535 [Drosophila innubila]
MSAYTSQLFFMLLLGIVLAVAADADSLKPEELKVDADQLEELDRSPRQTSVQTTNININQGGRNDAGNRCNGRNCNGDCQGRHCNGGCQGRNCNGGCQGRNCNGGCQGRNCPGNNQPIFGIFGGVGFAG